MLSARKVAVLFPCGVLTRVDDVAHPNVIVARRLAAEVPNL